MDFSKIVVVVMSFTFLDAAVAALPTQVVAENIFTHAKETVSFVAADKRATVVIFLSAKCPCSNSHISLLKEMSAKYKDFKFVAIHSNATESKEMAQEYFQKIELPFSVYQDDHFQIADLLRANKTPHVFVISPDGEIFYKGGVTNSANAPTADKNLLADALDDITQNKKVRVANGRTLGCSIVRETELK